MSQVLSNDIKPKRKNVGKLEEDDMILQSSSTYFFLATCLGPVFQQATYCLQNEYMRWVHMGKCQSHTNLLLSDCCGVASISINLEHSENHSLETWHVLHGWEASRVTMQDYRLTRMSSAPINDVAIKQILHNAINVNIVTKILYRTSCICIIQMNVGLRVQKRLQQFEQLTDSYIYTQIKWW